MRLAARYLLKERRRRLALVRLYLRLLYTTQI